MASLNAAPDGPETRPLLSAAWLDNPPLAARSPHLEATDVATRDAGREVSLESHISSTKMHHRSSESRTFNYVLQLPNIARPVVGCNRPASSCRSIGFFARSVRVALHEMLDQHQDVVLTVSQRWHLNGNTFSR